MVAPRHLPLPPAIKPSPRDISPVVNKRGGRPAQPAPSQPQPIRKHKDGVLKRRAGSPAARADAPAKPPPARELLIPEEPRENFLRIPGAFVD
ncbi:hypothetical protein F4819DRAFT_460263 [Hypoxylon fuscum]|nr:hypothetical protein F4819DRAFT_460263 [Hypoxylon fuscum]